MLTDRFAIVAEANWLILYYSIAESSIGFKRDF